MRPEEGKVIGLGLEEDGREGMEEVMSEGSEGEMDEAELERRVEILERMRARRGELWSLLRGRSKAYK